MRRRQLKPSAIQDVCIFCTTRLQLAPTYIPILPQRRLFRSGDRTGKPPEAALAQQQDSTSDTIPEDSRDALAKRTPSRGRWGSWGPAPNSPDTGQQWRVGANDQVVAGQSFPDRQRAAQQSRQNPQPPPTKSYLQSTAREGALKQHAEGARVSQANKQAWKCQCGLRNLPSETSCIRCHAPAPSTSSASRTMNPDDPRIAQSWKQARRVDEAERTDPLNDPLVQRPKEAPVDHSQDEARVRRFEESKGSRFVGLENKFKRPSFGGFQDARRVQSEVSESWHYSMPQFSLEAGGSARIFKPENMAATIQGESLTPAQKHPQQAESRDGWRRFTPPPASPSERTHETLQPSPVSSVPKRVGWAKWTPEDLKADPKVFTTPQQPEQGHVSMNEKMQEPSPIGWRKWTPAEADTADQGYGQSQGDLSANERRAQNRMTRRLQELEEEQEKKAARSKPTTPRFDTSRESRRSMMQNRKFIEKQSSFDDYDDFDEDASRRRQERKKEKKKQQAAQKLQGPPTPIYLPEFISVANLAGVLRIKIEDFTSKMTELGFQETTNDHVLDAETAGLIASEFNFEPIVDQPEIQDLVAQPPAEDKSRLPQRPPVVTIMGHVDHGKTTLLDWLRKSSVAATEHGGITQHIGAFSVPMPSGRIITFLDTPGHAAFLDMRQRGANVTDIVILVVAADDSVKPQTVEAIKHAQAAQVPMIVAVNKIDKEDANVEKVKQDLARYGVEIEDYGGDTQVVCVSGKTGQGMETLEESAVALADILDMRAEVDGAAEGWVLEATTKKAGRLATVLVRRGTLRPSDIIVAGTTWARVRTLHNEAGVSVESAGPGTPVEVDGWRDQPTAGDEVLQANSEQHARSVIGIRLEAAERVQLATDTTAVNESRRLEQERREAAEAASTAAQAGEEPLLTPTEPKEAKESFKEVPLIVKADVSGSAEAVLTSILSLGNSSVRPTILRSGVGAVSEFDVSHAASAKAHIVCFNIVMEQHIRRMAEAQGVRVVEQNIIYRLVDAVMAVLEEYLEPIRTKRVLGEAEVAQVFDINVRARITVPIAGCRIRNGVIARNAKVMVRRDGEVVFDGSLSSLKNRKQDATEMRKGTECGMGFEGWKDFQVGDQVQSYEEKVERRTL